MKCVIELIGEKYGMYKREIFDWDWNIDKNQIEYKKDDEEDNTIYTISVDEKYLIMCKSLSTNFNCDLRKASMIQAF